MRAVNVLRTDDEPAQMLYAAALAELASGRYDK